MGHEMTDFKRGDRVKVVACFDGMEPTYLQREGSVFRADDDDVFVAVEIDYDDGFAYFYPDELRKVTREKTPITQDEFNHERAQYEATIDNLNQVLDEIQDMVGPGSNSRVSSDAILRVLSKRPA